MSDDILPPKDESSQKFQAFDALSELEEGDTIAFTPELASRDVVEITRFLNVIIVTVDVATNQLGKPVRISLAVSFEAADDPWRAYDSMSEMAAHINKEDEDTSLGTIETVTLVDDEDGDTERAVLEWTPRDDVPLPAAPPVADGPIEEPQAVLDDHRDDNVTIETTVRGDETVAEMFQLQLTNHGTAKAMPFSSHYSVGEIDISMADRNLEDRLKDVMNRRVRLALEQQGRVPMYLLDEDDH
jgi:hypothetical protein